MLPKLLETPKFKEEYEKYQKIINKIADQNKKQDLLNDLNLLKKYANEIDIGHNSDYNGFIKPAELEDIRDKINKLRITISKKIKSLNSNK